MKPCPDGKHHFVPYESTSMWSTPIIYCRQCGIRGPFEFTPSSTSTNPSTKEKNA